MDLLHHPRARPGKSWTWQQALDADQIASARKPNAADPESATILASAVTVDDRRGTVTDQDLAAARTTGSTDKEIAEITGHVALNMPASYLNKAARMDIDIPVAPG